jgi:hypothetical protein
VRERIRRLQPSIIVGWSWIVAFAFRLWRDSVTST